MRVLITGAAGSLGRALLPRLDSRDEWLATDQDNLDVTDAEAVKWAFHDYAPDLVYHLAAAKHAPEGELDPWHVARTNIIGTRNVLATGARTILASTCKAADPETVYGASKLIAERMTLAAGGSVVRFYNVPETCGNVFELWRSLPEDEPLPVMDCFRYFVSLERAVDLLVWAADARSGRYTLAPDRGRWMWEEAAALGREWVMVPRRRGDRKIEPPCAKTETLTPLGDGIVAIESIHDRALVAA